MNVLLWAIFGIANSLLLNTLDKNPKKEGAGGAMLMGIFGALSGGAIAYLLFGGMSNGFNLTLLLVMFFEAILIYTLTSTNKFNKA